MLPIIPIPPIIPIKTMLKGYYYDIESIDTQQGGGPSLSATCRVRLRKGCDIYRGHFPNAPVCPGVCGIQMILECCMMATHKRLRIASIRKCRFPALATPQTVERLALDLQLTMADGCCDTKARLSDGGKNYVEFHGCMTETTIER